MTTVSVTTHLLDTQHKPLVLSQLHNIPGHKNEVYCFLQDTRVLLDIFLQCLCNVDLEHSRLHQTCNRNLNYMERKINEVVSYLSRQYGRENMKPWHCSIWNFIKPQSLKCVQRSTNKEPCKRQRQIRVLASTV